MAIWKEQTTPTKEPPAMPQSPAPQRSDDNFASAAPSYNTPSRSNAAIPRRNSDRAISHEGKIQVAVHVLVPGARVMVVEGQLRSSASQVQRVRASTVTLAGELEGNVDAARASTSRERGSAGSKAGSYCAEGALRGSRFCGMRTVPRKATSEPISVP